MAEPTIWMRPALTINDWHSAPVEYLKPLFGPYRALHIHLVDGGTVSKSYVKDLQDIGYKIFGTVGDYYAPHQEWTDWVDAAFLAASEVGRLALSGFVGNFEDAWEAKDLATGGKWSSGFVNYYRNSYPKKNLALNTFDECGGINLLAWAKRDARLYVQTYKGGVEPPAIISVQSILNFALRYGWPKKKIGAVKPCLAVFKGSTGVRVPVSDQITSMHDARTIGFTGFYADGAFDVTTEYLLPLAQKALIAGVAR